MFTHSINFAFYFLSFQAISIVSKFKIQWFCFYSLVPLILVGFRNLNTVILVLQFYVVLTIGSCLIKKTIGSWALNLDVFALQLYIVYNLWYVNLENDLVLDLWCQFCTCGANSTNLLMIALLLIISNLTWARISETNTSQIQYQVPRKKINTKG